MNKRLMMLKGICFALMFFVHTFASAFKGSDLVSGKSYYLFNIYQSKFLGADNKLQSPNIGVPVLFTASSTGFTISGSSFTAIKIPAGFIS